MAWFKKKDDVIDLTEYYKKRKEFKEKEESQTSEVKDLQSGTNVSQKDSNQKQDYASFGFLKTFSNLGKKKEEEIVSSGDAIELNTSSEEKRKRLAKRLVDMTDRMEDLSNQIYKLQQRVEVLERKSGRSSYVG